MVIVPSAPGVAAGIETLVYTGKASQIAGQRFLVDCKAARPGR